MSKPVPDHEQLTLSGLAHRCAEESRRFFRQKPSDPRFCFEIFRRAILERNERAWSLIYQQFSPLVSRWVQAHAAFQDSGEEVQYFVNRAFDRMWTAVTPEKFERYTELNALLRYMQMCVHSAIIDQFRKKTHTELTLQAAEAQTGGAPRAGLEAHVIDRLQGQVLWEEITRRLKNEKERLVIYASFVLALKAREIFEEHKDDFEDIREIYLIKQNVLARLRRDQALKTLFGS